MIVSHWFAYNYLGQHGPWYTAAIWGNVFVILILAPLGWAWAKSKFWPLNYIEHGVRGLHQKVDEHRKQFEEHRQHQHEHNEWVAQHVATVFELHTGVKASSHPQFGTLTPPLGSIRDAAPVGHSKQLAQVHEELGKINSKINSRLDAADSPMANSIAKIEGLLEDLTKTKPKPANKQVPAKVTPKPKVIARVVPVPDELDPIPVKTHTPKRRPTRKVKPKESPDGV